MEITTIAQAKQYLADNNKTGVKCPCCDRLVKVYNRTITSAMAYGLILMHKKGDNDFFHMEEYLKSIPNTPSSLRGDVPKLRFWGMIQRMDEKREDGNPNNGFYKVTDQGRMFCKGEIKVISNLLIYQDKVIGHEGSMTTIQEALGNKFYYNELMGYPPPPTDDSNQTDLFGEE
jgi:hypothetical protein